MLVHCCLVWLFLYHYLVCSLIVLVDWRQWQRELSDWQSAVLFCCLSYQSLQTSLLMHFLLNGELVFCCVCTVVLSAHGLLKSFLPKWGWHRPVSDTWVSSSSMLCSQYHAHIWYLCIQDLAHCTASAFSPLVATLLAQNTWSKRTRGLWGLEPMI